MKSNALSALVVLFILVPSICLADDGLYLGVNTGATVIEATSLTGNFNPIELDFSPGYLLGINAGYQMVKGRVEIAYSFRSAEIESSELLGNEFDPGGEFLSHSVMVNSIAEYNRRQRLQPYLLVGAGYALVELNEDLNVGIDIVDNNDTVFAYQVGTGVGISLSRSIMLDIGYRYFTTGEIELEATADRKIETDYETHNLVAGLRLFF